MRNIAFLLALCLVHTGETPHKAVPADVSQLVSAERTLDARDAGGLDGPSEVLGVTLAGFNFYREVLIGKGIRVIVISRTKTLGGTLLVFDASGTLASSRETNQEILSMQLVDLDHDGVDEIITEEIGNATPGYFETEFVAYRVWPPPCQDIWRGEAWLSVNYPLEHNRERHTGFVRVPFEGDAGPYNRMRLVHVLHDEVSGKWITNSVTLQRERVTVLPKNGQREKYLRSHGTFEMASEQDQNRASFQCCCNRSRDAKSRGTR